MRAYTYTPGTGSTAGSFNTTPAASLSVTAAPVVSANGASNGIVWAESTSGVMYATSAGTLTQLYTTSQASGGRDTAPTFVKFTSPVIANGKVYLSGQGSLAVYGELP
jgi:outer membrane protein assembly factor BamB